MKKKEKEKEEMEMEMEMEMVGIYLEWKWSSGWLESWEGLLLHFALETPVFPFEKNATQIE